MWCHGDNSLNSDSIVKSNSVVSSSRSNVSHSNTIPLTNMSFAIKPLNLQGGQCTWCGKYGHKRLACPLLK
ncbi:uncharacterized protein B0P05DRAFT_543875 [Gilbertella persicaria]|uniref:CCHC-type domain-containing protein n=1 Tax=Rhizopus stolonifer TaxID=4846 RepID=A0A367K4P9_RHIST|nr:uncharacterized protein B0P05DRAFT_543875 [Gilbertella persicaria]KAI8078038.1 hypothetical protein B0P05DRAFT_543875 [Gilbertella persicaria]RCH97157.1 hypothetical protein CU098_011445 [Rhizopus stolonifer]